MIWRILNFCCSLFLGNGVFYFDGIFSFKSIGKISYQSGIMMAQAMRYAVLSVKNLLVTYYLLIHLNSKKSAAIMMKIMHEIMFYKYFQHQILS